MHGVGWGWWVLMSLGMVVFWVAIVFLVVWFVRGAPSIRSQERRQEPPTGDSALEVLRRRLAAGEVSSDEYEEIRRRLDISRDEPVSVAGQPREA